MNSLKVKKEMKAAVFKGKGRLEVENVPLPVVKEPDDVLFQVEACGICGTELHITSLPQRHVAGVGTILGHEYIGKVIKVGKGVKSFKPGDRVVPNSMTPCGACEYCNIGFPNICKNIIRLGVFNDGGFAEYSLLPERALYKISEKLPKELGILIEPIACVINNLKSMGSIIGKSVVILGGGPMGQLFVQLIKKSGAGVVILSEISEYRSRLGKINGADFTINPDEENIEEFVKEKIGNDADITLDAVGSLFEQALRITGKGGMVVLFGNDSKAVVKIKPTDILLNEIKIVNSFAVKNTYIDAIKIVENGLVDHKGIITKKIPLESLNEGIELLRKQKELKIIVEIN